MSSKKRHRDDDVDDVDDVGKLLEGACNVLEKASGLACAVEGGSSDNAKNVLRDGIESALGILERARKMSCNGASSPPGQAAALQAAEQLATENKKKDELIKQLQEQVKQLSEQQTGHGHQPSEPQTEDLVERVCNETHMSRRAVMVCVLHPKSALSWLISKDLIGTSGLKGKSEAVQRWSKECSEFHKRDFFCPAEDFESLCKRANALLTKDKWRYALTVRIFRDYEQIFGRFKAEAVEDDHFKMRLSAIKRQYTDGTFVADVEVESEVLSVSVNTIRDSFVDRLKLISQGVHGADQPWQQDRTWHQKVGKDCETIMSMIVEIGLLHVPMQPDFHDLCVEPGANLDSSFASTAYAASWHVGLCLLAERVLRQLDPKVQANLPFLDSVDLFSVSSFPPFGTASVTGLKALVAIRKALPAILRDDAVSAENLIKKELQANKMTYTRLQHSQFMEFADNLRAGLKQTFSVMPSARTGHFIAVTCCTEPDKAGGDQDTLVLHVGDGLNVGLSNPIWTILRNNLDTIVRSRAKRLGYDVIDVLRIVRIEGEQVRTTFKEKYYEARFALESRKKKGTKGDEDTKADKGTRHSLVIPIVTRQYNLERQNGYDCGFYGLAFIGFVTAAIRHDIPPEILFQLFWDKNLVNRISLFRRHVGILCDVWFKSVEGFSGTMQKLFDEVAEAPLKRSDPWSHSVEVVP